MEIRILGIDNKEEILKLTNLLNLAFGNRSTYSSINPYIIMTQNQVKEEISKNDTFMYVMVDKGNIIGSTCCSYKINNGIKVGLISRVCVHPRYQGQGIARKILELVHMEAQKAGCKEMSLSVGSIWKDAIGLYKSLGYKEYRVVAHVPRTYLLIIMKKIFPNYAYPEWKRCCRLFLSKCKLSLLFYKDSTPNALCRILYKIK